MREDLGVLVHAAVLHHRVRLLRQVVVRAQAAREEEDLRVEGPGGHVRVEVRQVGILRDGLVERLRIQALAQHADQRGLAHADVAGNGDELLHRLASAFTGTCAPSPCILLRRQLGVDDLLEERERVGAHEPPAR